jgi:hypothetical protein
MLRTPVWGWILIPDITTAGEDPTITAVPVGVISVPTEDVGA